MRRSAIASLVIPVFGLALLGAPCVSKGPQNDKQFAADSLIIPMDNCYQYRDGTVKAAPCNQTADDGIFRAYGLVYFLLKNGVTVYWAIDGATPKGSVTTPDITVSDATPIAEKLDWSTGNFSDLGAGSSINYQGGPFIIDSTEMKNVVKLLTGRDLDHPSDPIGTPGTGFLRFRDEAVRGTNPVTVEIHRVKHSFVAKQVRPLNGPPPKLAILNINPYNRKTSVNVMYRYAVAAGLSWPCQGNGDCAGGVTGDGVTAGKGCNLAALYAYLANPGGDTAIPQVCDAGLCAPMFNSGSGTTYSGTIYDVLCDTDFVRPSGGAYADTELAKGGYKLLWAPHWDTANASGTPIDPTNPTTQPAITLAAQLNTIADFVASGNNLFAECYAIMALEGIQGETIVTSNGTQALKGIPVTRFQSPSGISYWNGNGTLQSFIDPAHPNMQIGDFTYSVVSGAITTYYPNWLTLPASTYLADTKRLITKKQNTSGTCNPACQTGYTCISSQCRAPWWDVSSTIITSQDLVPKGSVAYLGGHDYSPSPDDAWPHSEAGQTAGTRIVLNTLFNLGFGCVEPTGPDAVCNTGLQGVCAAGTLKCSGGALTCVPTTPAQPTEICNNEGKDYNCDGVPGQNCTNGEDCVNGVCVPKLCTNGQTQSCYEGTTATRGKGICQDGTQTCGGGVWGVCTGQVLPGPAVCNGKDNDCSGAVDTDCPAGRVCTNGVCLPSTCGLEDEMCPTGFDCTAGTCTQVSGCSATCQAGWICNGSTCVDPCASVSCPQGTVCAAGTCQAGGCYFSGCSASGQVCSQGTCVTDPCAGVSCPSNTFCRAGDCVRSCEAIYCTSGQVCGMDGYCEPDCSPACGSGQICVSGACQTDPCTGKSCGTGQVCSGGACVDDPCRGVTCQSGTCSKGQCPSPSSQCTTSVPKIGLSGESPVASVKGGCSTSGTGGLASLVLMGLCILVLRRRPQAVASLARVAGLVVLLVAVAGCKSGGGGGGGGNTNCTGGQTPCGGTCVDLTSDASNCGVCGCACRNGFTCAQSACLLTTNNPYLSAISPSSTGSQNAVTLQLTGTGFQSNAVLRIAGAGLDGTYTLTDIGATSAKATLDTGVMGNSHVGTAQVRVVNDPSGQRLTSNALPFVVQAMPYLLGRSPTFVQQDTLNSSTTTISLTGTGFVTGLTATLTPDGGTTSQPIVATYVSATQCTVTLPTALALGTYLIQVTNPGGASTNTMPVAVREGVPVVTPPASLCRPRSQLTFTETLTGSYLYPTSVAHVSGNGLTNAVPPTACFGGSTAIDATTGQCQSGLSVTVDLTLIQNGTYSFTIWNPGSPSHLESTPPLTITIKDTCP